MAKGNLAMAYAMKRRSGKKMAKGGQVPAEDMGRGYFKPHEGPQTGGHNESLHPEYSPEHGAKDLNLSQQRFSRPYLSHGALPKDVQYNGKGDPELFQKRGVNPIRQEPKMAQVKLPQSAESQHFADGGAVLASMGRRERALYAARGKPIRPNDDYAERYPGVEKSANQGPSLNGGPSGATTRMPMNPQGRITPEEQAMFAHGGPVAMADHHRKMSAHYQKLAEGGSVSPTKTHTSTSTTGNKTKTGGSNPGGASTGGAGTVTISTGKMPPEGINISNVGGKTDAKNHGGMDPGDIDDPMAMAYGGYASPHQSNYDQGSFYDEGGEVDPSKVEGDMADAKSGTAMDSSQKPIEKAGDVPDADVESSGGNEASTGDAGANALAAGMKSFGEGIGGGAINNAIKKGIDTVEGLVGGGGGGGGGAAKMLALGKGGIAHEIMKKRMAAGGMASMKENYAEGGPVDEMGLQDQEYDQDRFLSQHMPDMRFSRITKLDAGDLEEHEDPKLKRKTMLSDIMKGLHAKHYGKRTEG